MSIHHNMHNFVEHSGIEIRVSCISQFKLSIECVGVELPHARTEASNLRNQIFKYFVLRPHAFF